ncbi:MAG: LTA synthase family protein [Gammaproteobacteria bacterium]|nr:LTA synthase family protein [Gammaproteobacteria bacterium]
MALLSTKASIIPRLLVITAAALVLASFAARLGIYLAHTDFFAGISAAEFSTSALRGLRYDIAAIALTCLPPLLLMLLPGNAWPLRYVRNLGFVLFAVAVAATLLFGIASTQFFAFFYRHLGVEVKAVISDFDFILQMALEQNLPALLAVLCGLAVTFIVGYRVIPKLPAPAYGVGGYAARLGLLLLVSYFTLWGGPARQWVDEKHAFAAQDLRLGPLVQNPAFAAFNNLFFPQSIAAAQQGINSDVEDAGLPENNALGQSLLTDITIENPNVVMVVLESWTPGFIGSFGAEQTATPNFDRIVANGLRYQQMYANGPISIYGLQALLTGVPHLPGMPLMGFGGVETLAIKGIAERATEHGYQTLWAQAPRRASFNMDRLAQRWGFTTIGGKEDFHTPSDWVKTPFGWDWPLYEYALTQFNGLANQGPFFATLYTGVTHVPYVQVPEAHQRRPHNPDGVDGYINTLSRADWALGKFWQQAQQTAWHKNTVYVFVADHVVPKDMPDKSVKGRYRIPFAIVGPGITAGDSQQIASQVDVLPTALSLMGAYAPSTPPASTLVSDGAMNYWISSDVVLGKYRQKPVFTVEGQNSGGTVSPALEQAFLQRQAAIYRRYLALQ